MSADIGPGDFVECVCAEDCPVHGPSGLNKGSLYVVEAVFPESVTKHGLGSIKIVGKRSGSKSRKYGAFRFRPIYRPKPDAFTDLLKVPDRKRVGA